MPSFPAPRLLLALGVVAASGVVALSLGSGVQPTLVLAIGAVAAVMLAALGGDLPEPPQGMTIDTSGAPDPSLDEIIAAIAEPVLVVADGLVTHANDGARDLLGLHIVGEDVRLAIRHPGAAERLANPVAGAPQGPIDLVGLGTLDQRWQMRVARTTQGQRIVHLADRTGSYTAERMRVDFVANASHELRTPLASILGYIETLSDDQAGADTATRARFLKVMDGEARRMQRLVQDLISLSRIEADKYRLPDHPVDLAQLIDEVRAELIQSEDSRRGEIVVEIARDTVHVTGDRVQLSQLLHNLVGNAIKYGRAGAPVVVRLRRDRSGMMRLSVTDEGDGISPEHIPRLTERFYRVDAGRSRAAGGTGLGLAIVKHIVERHRGRLDIASTVGMGTTITVVLPAHASAVTKG